MVEKVFPVVEEGTQHDTVVVVADLVGKYFLKKELP